MSGRQSLFVKPRGAATQRWENPVQTAHFNGMRPVAAVSLANKRSLWGYKGDSVSRQERAPVKEVFELNFASLEGVSNFRVLLRVDDGHDRSPRAYEINLAVVFELKS
jgi:hypothetical protein